MRVFNILFTFILVIGLSGIAGADHCEDELAKVESNFHSCHNDSDQSHVEGSEKTSSEKTQTTCDMPCCHITLKQPDFFVKIGLNYHLQFTHPISNLDSNIKNFNSSLFRPPIKFLS